MTRLFYLMSFLVVVLTVLSIAACSRNPDAHTDPAEEVAQATLVHVGDMAPDITCELLGGGFFDLQAHRGQVVLVNFFATWCPPCQAEMPYLRSQVWERFAGPDFALVSIAREEEAVVVAPFVADRELTWPVALDPDREVFARYATAYIPRNFVIDRSGVVIYQSQGFEAEEFAAMLAVIERELQK